MNQFIVARGSSAETEDGEDATQKYRGTQERGAEKAESVMRVTVAVGSYVDALDERGLFVCHADDGIFMARSKNHVQKNTAIETTCQRG